MIQIKSSLLAFCALSLFAGIATAAGTVMVTETTPAMFTAGPFVNSNKTFRGGTARTCAVNAQGGCDTTIVEVKLPADFDVSNPNKQIRAEISWANANEDFDLYISNTANCFGIVGTAEGSANPEVVTIPAGKGDATYRLCIIAFQALGGNVTAKVSIADGAIPPPPAPVPVAPGLPPRFKVHPAPPTLANDAGEPTVGYNPLSKRAMFIAYLQANRITFKENLPAPADPLNDALPESCDAQWEDKSGLITTVNTVDPLMYTDKVTGRTFNSQLAGANSLFEYSDDDGENWTPGQAGPANGGADHQGMVTGPYPEGRRPPTATYPNAFYYCSQSVGVAFCARSDDGARTQGPGMPFKNTACGAGALHGHPQVAPDGTLYVPDSTQCVAGAPDGTPLGTAGKVVAFVSVDAGMTFATRPVPTSEGGAGSDPSIGIAADGTIYMCYENADSRARMAVSKDKGVTWINDTDIGAAAGLVATRFPAAIAGDPDRAACAFLGTTTPGPSASLDFKGVWHGYVATTYDGGLTYHLVNVTPNDPIQGHGGVGPDGTNRNLLDFNDLEIDERGRTLFAYADGCIGGCVKDPAANSFAAKGALVRQTGGRTLLAEFDNGADTQYNDPAPIKPAAACAVQAASVRSSLRTVVRWNAPDNGGGPITNYEVFRSTSPAGPFTSVGNAGVKTEFKDEDSDITVEKYYYRIVAENAQGKAAAGNIIELPITVEEIVNTCELPGAVIAQDARGDGTAADTDIEYLAAAEPEAFEGNLVVTVKVVDFSSGSPPPSSFYPVLFPSRGNLYIALDATAGPVAYTYGTYEDLASGVLAFTEEGNIDPRSGFTNDGTITLVASKELFGGLNPGDVLAGFDARARVGAQSASSRDTAGPADYTVRGTAICQLNTAPLASLTSNVDRGKPGDTVTFTINGSDADAGDTIAKFSLNFGDSSAEIADRAITTLPVTVTHAYTSNGNYAARLTVTDSRGLVSSNVARQFINISSTAAPPGGPAAPGTIGGNAPPSTEAGGGRFGGAWGLALLPLALLALRRRR